MSIAFLGAMSLATANSFESFTDCHAQACQEIAMWEDEGDVSEAMADEIYAQAYNECNS